MTFRAVVELGGRTATGLAIPDAVIEALGAGKRPPVRVTVAGHTYRTTVATMGGRFMIPLSAENRTAAGVEAGDEVDVEIALDDQPRTVEVPDDLAGALGTAGVREAFDALATSHRREHVRSVTDAKAAPTRERRIRKVVAALGGS